MKKKAVIGIIIIAILFASLCFWASNPPVAGKDGLPDEYLQAIENQARGVYSSTLPLLPVRISVDSFSAESVYYTIHYFPVGTVGMSYSATDGYNVEKPLTNL